MGDGLFNSPLPFVVRYGRKLFSTPALGCAIRFTPVTADADKLTAWDLPPFAPWLAPLGPDSLCEGPKWLEPKLMEKIMKNQINTSVKLSQDKKTIIVSKGGVPAFISVNLIKHMLDIPYTKKDGTKVSVEEIQAMKQIASTAYAEAVVRNSQALAAAGA